MKKYMTNIEKQYKQVEKLRLFEEEYFLVFLDIYSYSQFFIHTSNIFLGYIGIFLVSLLLIVRLRYKRNRSANVTFWWILRLMKTNSIIDVAAAVSARLPAMS